MKSSTLTILVSVFASCLSWAASISSDFSTGDDDWRGVRVIAAETYTSFSTYFTAPFPPPFGGSAGTPGGAISIQDIAGEAGAEFSAPAKFLGNKSGFYGGTFSWDYLSTGGSIPVDPVHDLVLVGAGLVLLLDAGPSPAPDLWAHRTATLTEGAGWRIGGLAGRPPSEAEFRAVLADLQGLYVESDLAAGGDTGFLDNVLMTEATGLPATLTLVASGVGPRSVTVQLNGIAGTGYRIESSPALVPSNWVTLTNLVLSSPIRLVSDPSPTTTGSRFYRVLTLP